MNTVLFLCTGNYYRSRYAEVFFNWQAERRAIPWRADSRGLALSPSNLGPMSHFTADRLQQQGISLDPYMRLPLDAAELDFERATRIVAVKGSEHRPLMTQRYPHWSERVEFWEVHDIDCAHPDQALPHLERQVMELFTRLEEPLTAKRVG